MCSCAGQGPATGTVFNIRHYGAKGDGATSDTRAIDKTIAACVRAGGGTVYVPAGIFVTGSVQLFSNVNLFLETGAVLLGSGDSSEYLIQKDFGFTNYGAGNKLGLVFAVHAENVSITGFGTIDGNPAGSLYMDSLQYSSPSDWQFTRQGRNYMMSPGDPAVPAYDRKEAPVMWKGLYADRPGVEITFYDCKKATLKDFTIRNAADWSIALLGCDDAKVLGISIRNNMSVPNSDGIDMYDCHDVIVSDCDIRAGDDAIAVISTTNLTVTNCNLTSRSSGIRIGYNGFNDDNSGNLLFDNIRIYGSNRGIGIFQRRKGNLSNMLFSNMIIDTRLYPGQWWGHGEPIHISALPGIGSKEVGVISNVRFENIIARGEQGIVLYGSTESVLKDISFHHVQLTISRGPLTDAEGGNFDLRATNDPALSVFKHDIPAVYAQYVHGLELKDLDVRWDSTLPAFFTHTIDCHHYQGLKIEGLSGATAPAGASDEEAAAPAVSGGVKAGGDDGQNGYGAGSANGAPRAARPHFVTTSGIAFRLDGKPYYYIGVNNWYGSLNTAGGSGDNAGRQRVRKELDFLVAQGVNNLRILAAAEGSGLLNGRERVGPPLQPAEGKFDERVFRGLDFLLAEMGKRHMKGVFYLSNNWEWSGGFLQYLNWHGLLPDSTMRGKMPYGHYRDIDSRFYSCDACMADYALQCKTIITRVNSITHRRYADDPAIMAWELGNEPRPMRPAANEAYRRWVAAASAYIKSLDPDHLITVGTEGLASTENMQLYEDIHADRNVDYLTIHIWPKNFGYFHDTAIAKSWDNIIGKAGDYIRDHVAVAEKLNKPMVIEEFGLPRDLQSFVPGSPTTLRDAYYRFIFEHCAHIPVLAGCNIWAFGGVARPFPGQTFWKLGDTYMGDPPAEEQGLNSVFDVDGSTWRLVRAWTRRVNAPEYKVGK